MSELHDVDVSGELSVTIDAARWDVCIVIRDAEGHERVYIASADVQLTERDGIWFGTDDEYEEALR